MKGMLTSVFYFLFVVMDYASTSGIHAASERQDIEESADQRVVEEVVRQFVQAWNRDDAEALSLLFTPNGRLTSPRGSTARGRREIRELLMHEHQEIFIGTSLSKTIQTITFPNVDNALVKGKFKLSGLKVFLGFTTAVNGTFTLRLVREANWLIEDAHISRTK